MHDIVSNAALYAKVRARAVPSKLAVPGKYTPKRVYFSRFNTFSLCQRMYYLKNSRDYDDVVEEKEGLVQQDQYNAALGSTIQAIIDGIYRAGDKDPQRFLPKVRYDLRMLCTTLTTDITESGVVCEFPDNFIQKEHRKFYVEEGPRTKLPRIREKLYKAVYSTIELNLDKILEYWRKDVLSEHTILYKDEETGIVHKIIIDFLVGDLIIDGKLRYQAYKDSTDQLVYYAAICERVGIKINKLRFWEYSSAKTFKAEFTKADMDAAYEKATKFYRRISTYTKEEDFSRCPNYYCRYCEEETICQNIGIQEV